MNKKRFIFSAIGTLFLSFAVAVAITPKNLSAVKADTPVDVGQINLSLNLGSSEVTTSNAIHLLSDVTNDFPVNGWDNYFTSTESNSLTLNGVDIHNGSSGTNPVRLKKIDAKKYYLALVDSGLGTRNEGDTVVIKGNWTGTVASTTYTLLIKDFSATWNGSKWVQNFVVPELEPYDKVSLKDLSIDDFNYRTMSTEGETNNYNSFTPSANNPHNNFAFEFYYEANAKIDRNLDIRLGGDKAWDASSHFYHFMLNNSWGPHGLAFFYEKTSGGSAVHSATEIDCDLTINVRHTIEVGSIVVKDTTTNETYFYIKNDGEFIYQEVYSVQTLEHTSRISFSYDKTNIFIGNTLEQKTNTDSLTFKNSDGLNGVYLNGPENAIPLNKRMAPATKYNLFRNNGLLYNFQINGTGPLKKTNTQEYYVSFSENNIEVEEGDVISIGGEFHLYSDNQSYTLAVIPFCIKRVGNQFVDMGTLNSYLGEQITNYVDFDNYDNDKVSTLNGLIAATQANVQSANTVKAKWQAFEDGKDEIDAVPPKEELLNREKQLAIDELNTYDDEFLYEEAELIAVRSYIEAGITAINAATTIKQVKTALNNAVSQIKTLTTRQEHIEHRILNEESGYEEYLEKREVITTTDLCAIGDLTFYAKGSSHETYWTQFGANSIYGRFATANDNQNGNVAFQFKYESTNPLSNQYGAQIFIRLRGIDSDNYQFRIATDVDGDNGVSLGKLVNNVFEGKKDAKFNFAQNTEYTIEVGAVNIQDYDRVYLYLKIDGSIKVADIVDPISVSHTPTILIQDSYTLEGSEETVTIKPLETGTTKEANALHAGRLVVDDSSNNETLIATLRKNSIPNSTNLYPIQANAFKYNDHELDNYHAGAMVRKLTNNQYLITTSGLTISDGDRIEVGGCFAYFTEGSYLKTAVKLSNTVFTYHASSNSWTQSEQSLGDAKEDAKAYLDSYVILDDYSDANRATIEDILTNYKAQINSATTVEQVYQLLDAAIVAIDAVPTILGEYKNAAKTALNSYKSPSIYREEEQNQLAKILADAYLKIDGCGDKDSVDYVVLITKQAIDQLKTAAEYDTEELQSEQRSAKAEIETFVGKVELERYSEEDAARIQQLVIKARKDVDAATSIEEVQRILAEFKQAIKDIKTIDGTVFDGETYVKPGANGLAPWVLPVIIAGSSVLVLGIAAVVVLIILKKKGILFKK